MSDLLNIIVLAVIQGLTEFLPVSSSGHLALAKDLLGFDSVSGLGVTLLLHLGTVVAVCLFYRKFLCEWVVGLLKFQGKAWGFMLAIILSMIPAVLAGLFFKETLDGLAEYPAIVAVFLIVTALLLFSTRFISAPTEGASVSPIKGFLLGLAQAFALLPGVSRSGSTLVVSQFLGIDAKKAARFSFVMVIPVIVGASLFEAIKAQGEMGVSVFDGLTLTTGIIGFLVSAIVGFLSVAFMVKLVVKRGLWCFGFYCMIVGVAYLTVCALRA